MVVVAWLITLALLVMLATLLHNWWCFPRLTPPQPQVAANPAPAISVLIPARNEAHQIGGTVSRLLQQDYPNFEVLVLDDHSEDGTDRLAKAAAGGDARLRVLHSSPLPAGWGGKNWACHQLAAAARADYLLFTDADVQWQPGALQAVMALHQQSKADLLTVWPTQITVTWGERLVVPLMSFAIWAYLPVWLAHYTPFASAAAANGQCLLFRRATYSRSGGHMAVRGRVLDDVLLAQLVKATGGRLRMADGAGLICCRMYDGWRSVLHGYAKNILAGHNSSPLFLVGSTIFHLTVFLGPWLWLLLGDGATVGWPTWPLALIGLAWLLRLLTAHATRQRRRDAFLMPLSVLLMTRIALLSLWWHWRHGAPQWKGRVMVN